MFPPVVVLIKQNTSKLRWKGGKLSIGYKPCATTLVPRTAVCSWPTAYTTNRLCTVLETENDCTTTS